MKLLVVFLFVVPFACGSIVSGIVDDFMFSAAQISEITELVAETALLNAAGIRYTIDSTLVPLCEDDVTFRFFNRKTTDVNGTVVYGANASVLCDMTEFDTSLETVFLTHGWNNNCTESPMITTLKDALLATRNVNIFTVCWDDFSNGLYTVAYAAVPQVGNFLGQFIGNISNHHNYSLTNFKLLGHSLGAHISGFSGKQLNGRLPHIVGLDPAAPLYSKPFWTYRLASTDAHYVEAIHTAGSLLGTAYNVADVDFWPNGGLVQPGCGVDVVTTCSHGRAYYYYAEAILNNTFASTKCSLYAPYLLGTCKNNDRCLMGGYSYNTSMEGTFYLKTKSSPPYGMGE